MTGRKEDKPDYSLYPTLDYSAAHAAGKSLLEMKGCGAPASDATLRAIERFYFREARLLDEERLSEWYDLLEDDLFYWMPLRENRFRRDTRGGLATSNMAFFDDCKADIAVRIGRVKSGLVWTEDPPSRHVYAISNIEAFHTKNPTEFEAHSVFTQYRNRGEHEEVMLAGRRRDLLRFTEHGLKIARRLVLLNQSVLLTKNLTVFF